MAQFKVVGSTSVWFSGKCYRPGEILSAKESEVEEFAEYVELVSTKPLRKSEKTEITKEPEGAEQSLSAINFDLEN